MTHGVAAIARGLTKAQRETLIDTIERAARAGLGILARPERLAA